jgi:GNAT superfamily N-acetyltransferase
MTEGSTVDARHAPFSADQLRVVPANEAGWDDIVAVFGGSYPGRCKCQRFKGEGWIWHRNPADNAQALREQTGCDDPDATTTTGLIGYIDGEPAGWVAVEPRLAYSRLRATRMVWKGRDDDKDDPDVWAITCFCVRTGYRGRGLTYLLADAAIEHARAHGARAVEGYAMLTQAGKTITWGELHVGAAQVFADAGMREVTHPSLRRMVMRIDFPPD